VFVSHVVVLCLSDNLLVDSHSSESRRVWLDAFLWESRTEYWDECPSNVIAESCADGPGAMKGHPVSCFQGLATIKRQKMPSSNES
jgi:hypothetical protein